jgi:hypothetical protein
VNGRRERQSIAARKEENSAEPFPSGMRPPVPTGCALQGQEDTSFDIFPAKNSRVFLISTESYPQFTRAMRRFCPLFQPF